MGVFMRKALSKQKQFYIYELMRTGQFVNPDLLSQWTVSDLRHEYEKNKSRRKRNGGDDVESASS
jgi:hypothetical protein